MIARGFVLFKTVFIVVLVSWMGRAVPAFAQSDNAGRPRFTIQGPADQSAMPVIRDALNRPCLDTEAISRAHIVNTAIFDHVVSIKNRCVRLIKVMVCYSNSDICKKADIGGYQREDLILGTAKMNYFRYTIIQK